MLLLAGLGNPGPKYAANRHNIGFLAADAIAARYRFQPWRSRFQSDAAEGELGGVKTLLLKPRTYMNESGRAIAEASRFFKISLPDIVILHDELDLPPGRLRAKLGGGNAGHNGLRSITAHLGNEYRRVRLGIGHPGAKELVHSYVLSDFAKAEHGWVTSLVGAIADNAELLARGEDASFQNRIHLAMHAAGFGDPAIPGERKA